MSEFAKYIDRRDLLTAIWAAEFVRHLDGKAELAESPVVLLRKAESAADCADRTVEAVRMLFEVEFQPLTTGCYMTWEKFVEGCRNNDFMDEDGFGELATADHHVSNLRVDPSGTFGARYVRPTWATHVCWYNK